MKLDVSILRYLGSDEFRMLQAVETGMKNHEYVPSQLVANCKFSYQYYPHATYKWHSLIQSWSSRVFLVLLYDTNVVFD